MKKTIFLSICTLSALLGHAQWFTSSDDYTPFPVGLRLDAVSQVLGPGARFALEYPKLTVKYRTHTDGNKLHQYQNQHLVVPAVTWFTALTADPFTGGTQRGWTLGFEYLIRRKSERGTFLEYGPGIGLGFFKGSAAWLGKDNGFMPGGMYLLPSFSLGFGCDLLQATNEKTPLLWTARLHVPAAFPTEKKLTALPMLQAGLSWLMASGKAKWVVQQRYVIQSRARPR